MKQNMEYLGGEVIEGTGASVNAPGLPAGTTTVTVTARDGDVFVSINGDAAANSSPIYAADGESITFGPFDNISSLGVFAAGSVFAHLLYAAERL